MSENLAGLVKLVGITIILIVLWVILSSYAGDSFLESGNLTNLMRRVSQFSILGIGVALVIMIGGIDLSLGSLVCLTACCLALFLEVDYQPFDAISVYEIRKNETSLVVAGDAEIQAGQVIRLHSAERNRSQTYTVQSVDSLESGEYGPAKLIRISGSLQRSVEAPPGGEVGKISIAEPIASTELLDGTATVVLGDGPDFAARDRLWLLTPDGGFKEETVRQVASSPPQKTLTLDLATALEGQWYAVGLRRQQRMSVPLAIMLSVLVATGLGLLHGVLVTWLRLQPFVVTLCGLLAYRGFARWLSNDQSVNFGSEYVDSLNWFSVGTVSVQVPLGSGFELAFPYAFFVFIVIAVLAMVLMNYTIWGRYILALGSNEEATRLSGVNTHRVKLVAYTLCGLLAGICGVLFAIESGSISPSSAGSYFELYAIAAAVLGGCSLRGGEGSILGVVVGTILMQTLNNMIVLLEIPNTFEQINLGGVILVAVIVDELVRRVFAHKRRNASQSDSQVTSDDRN